MDRELEILDIQGLARLLKIDPQTASRQAQRGKIPVFKIGNRWRFRLSDIMEWIGKKVPRSKAGRFENSRGDLLERLKAFFETRDDTHFVSLFGSQAKGSVSSRSDVDVAVLLKDEEKATLDSQSEMASRLMSLLNVGRVDVVFLNKATPLLCYEVIRDGKVIFADPQFDVLQYKTRVLSHYHDTTHLRDLSYNYFLTALHS